jgi:hypothetical protein
MNKKVEILIQGLQGLGLNREAKAIQNFLSKEAAPVVFYHSEEGDSKIEWEDWMKNIFTPIVVFSFNPDTLGEKGLSGLNKSFSREGEDSDNSDYEMTTQRYSIFERSSRTGDLHKLKEEFPKFKTGLEATLQRHNLKESEIIVMLYNKKPIQMGEVKFDRNAAYAVHDIFHFFEQSEPQIAAKFIFSLNNFISFALNLYKDSNEVSALENKLQNKATAKFFKGLYSLETDVKADLFSIAARGDLKNTLLVPDELQLDEKKYFINQEDKAKIENKFQEFVSEANEILHSKDLFSRFKGKVILHDFIP